MIPFLLYQSEDGRSGGGVNVRLEQETFWRNQKKLTKLFGNVKGCISEQIKHIFEDGELVVDSFVWYCRKNVAVQALPEVPTSNSRIKTS